MFNQSICISNLAQRFDFHKRKGCSAFFVHLFHYLALTNQLTKPTKLFAVRKGLFRHSSKFYTFKWYEDRNKSLDFVKKIRHKNKKKKKYKTKRLYEEQGWIYIGRKETKVSKKVIFTSLPLTRLTNPHIHRNTTCHPNIHIHIYI